MGVKLHTELKAMSVLIQQKKRSMWFKSSVVSSNIRKGEKLKIILDYNNSKMYVLISSIASIRNGKENIIS